MCKQFLLIVFFSFTGCLCYDVALVNLPWWHLEVFSGFLHVLGPAIPHITAYVCEDNFYSPHGWGGFFDWIGEHINYTRNSQDPDKPVDFRIVPPVGTFPHHDTLIFISPEYNPERIGEILNTSKPRQAILLVHEAHTGAIFKLQENVRDFQGIVRYLALAPHVADAVSKMNAVKCDWAFPVMPSTYRDCCSDYSCSGFTLQGHFEPWRRNYISLWEDVQDNMHLMMRSDRMRIKVLGHGKLSAINLTERVKSVSEVALDLPYPRFYKVIQDTIGVIPLFANDSYLQYKISSSLVTSYVTATPMIVDDKTYHAYKPFLSCGFMPCFFHHLPYETIVESMLRIVDGGQYYVCHVRRALIDHRRRLNQHAQRLLLSYLA